MINNFNEIEQFINFEEGTFYKFELLVRNTDGKNILFEDEESKTNKNILIKSWYVDNQKYYDKIKPQMIALSNITGARLYITLDRKDNLKLVQNLIKSFVDTLCTITSGQKLSVKNFAATFASETSKVENSSKCAKTIMFDVDTRDELIKNAVIQYITDEDQFSYVLNTKKGYHIFCYRKYNHCDWLEKISGYHYAWTHGYKIPTNQEILQHRIKLQEIVSVKENELGLVYHPMKDLNFIIDWQTKDQTKDDYLHKFETRSLDEARSFLNELRKNPNVVHIEKNKIAVEDLNTIDIIDYIE